MQKFTIKDLEVTFNVSRSTLYYWLDNEKFPAPDLVTDKSQAWSESSLRAARVCFRYKDHSFPENRVIAFVNQKGGVGKTTSVVNIGACLAIKGLRILIVDMDPQGNVGGSLKTNEDGPSIYDCFAKKIPPEMVIQSLPLTVQSELTPLQFKLDVLPSNIELAGLDRLIQDHPYRHELLHNLLHSIQEKYDYILIDCPPQLGYTTINGLFAASAFVVPTIADMLSTRGIDQLLATVEMVQMPRLEGGMGHPLQFLGLLINNRERTIVQDQFESVLRRRFGAWVFEKKVPHLTAFQQAKAQRQPVIANEGLNSSPASAAIVEVSHEVIARLKKVL